MCGFMKTKNHKCNTLVSYANKKGIFKISFSFFKTYSKPGLQLHLTILQVNSGFYFPMYCTEHKAVYKQRGSLIRSSTKERQHQITD